MYAELLPSAQRFISAVDEKVKVELRTMSGATGPLFPLRASPRWIAVVASPQFRAVRSRFLRLFAFAITSPLTEVAIPAWPGKEGTRSRVLRTGELFPA